MSAGRGSGCPGDRYDPVARRVHWLNAILALVTILLAWALVAAPRHGGARALLVTLHGSCGVAILALMLFWAGWRLRHRSPPLRPALSWIEVALAHATQAAIFLLFVAMPLTGYVSLAAAGKTLWLFGLVPIPALAPHSDRLSQIAIAAHLAGEFLVYALVVLHICAALMHGFVRRDGILERMLPPAQPDPATRASLPRK
ncbi:MAG TPA: cytochrome b [Stellaceae bacterium]|jgi:cytochrome b561|nr:cytochrome b [Stellaceae bacterium]